jgi:hypothetical protein
MAVSPAGSPGAIAAEGHRFLTTMAKARRKLSKTNAIEFISKYGVLLVFPVHNRELPPSLWAQFFPDTKMVWDWNEEADENAFCKIADCRFR